MIHEFGKRLRNTLDPTDCVARLGGDEFIALLTNIDSGEQVMKKAESVQQAISAPWTIQGNLLNITTSIDIALSSIQGTTTTSIFKEADKAMYDAKNAGKNLVRFNRSN
ncbi:diguanylate cyclase domain-containing protein [Psychrobacillus sp. BM2]|uniref:diguanylate cyclase domain-containing protein n=1 Tax=Psychrobacillus sp. BM2 TaxID=3400421 RepID=UPI003B02CF6D